MALNDHDQDAVLATYESIVSHESSWLLLAYGDHPDQLLLYGSGSGNLSDLKRKMDDLSQVFIAFYRDSVGYILINYIPRSVAGSRRARVLVHSRRIAALFQVDYASLTVDNLGNLTPASVEKAIQDPTTPHVIEMDRSISSPSPESPTTPEPVRRSFSEMYSPSTSPPAPASKSQSMFSSFLRRNKAPTKAHTFDESMPPPTPPKDNNKYIALSTLPNSSRLPSTSKALPVPVKDRRYSMSEFVIEAGNFDSDDEEAIMIPNPASRLTTSHFALPSKWVSESAVIGDPTERARRREVSQRQREIEEAQAIQEEKDRQARIKLRREEMLKQEQRQEADRRAQMEKEIARARAERRRKELAEKEEEEKKRVELAARKADARLKRQQEHAKLEQWRIAQRASAEESNRKQAEIIRLEQLEREKRIKQVEVKVKSALKTGETGQGWVSIQVSESIVWRRRYYKFTGNSVFFYRSPKDMDQALDKLSLRGELAALREWNEGYEELKALPHSFALEFNDRRGHWSMYTDTEDEKFQLLALLKTAAGL